MFSFQQNIKRDAGNREVLQVHKKKKNNTQKSWPMERCPAGSQDLDLIEKVFVNSYKYIQRIK